MVRLFLSICLSVHIVFEFFGCCVVFFVCLVLSCRGVEISNFLINRQHYQESSQYIILSTSVVVSVISEFRTLCIIKKYQTKLIGMCFYDDNSVQIRPTKCQSLYICNHKMVFVIVLVHIKSIRTICPRHADLWVCRENSFRILWFGFWIFELELSWILSNGKCMCSWPFSEYLFQFRFVNRLLYVLTTSIKTTHLMFEAGFQSFISCT